MAGKNRGETVGQSSKVASYKMNIQKSVVSINTNNTQLGKRRGRKDLIYNAVHCERERKREKTQKQASV